MAGGPQRDAPRSTMIDGQTDPEQLDRTSAVAIWFFASTLGWSLLLGGLWLVF